MQLGPLRRPSATGPPLWDFDVLGRYADVTGRDPTVDGDVGLAGHMDQLVPVPVPGARFALLAAVPESVAVADTGNAPALRIAARLLHDEGRRDAAARRVPPHREGDPWREAEYLRKHYRATGARGLPGATDFRAWRLGAPGSLAQEVGRRGLVPYPPSLEWSRWGW